MKYLILILGIILFGKNASTYAFENLDFSQLQNEKFAFFCLKENYEETVDYLNILHNIGYKLKENKTLNAMENDFLQNNHIKRDYLAIQKEEEIHYFSLAFSFINCKKLKKTLYGMLLPDIKELKMPKVIENLKQTLFFDKDHIFYINSTTSDSILNLTSRIHQKCSGEYDVCSYYCKPLKYSGFVKECVQCRENNECLSNQICFQGKCICENSFWNETEQKCVQCVKNEDCFNGRVCQKGMCVCESSIWDNEKSQCVECMKDQDCGENFCIHNRCSCKKGLWHKKEKKCVECLNNENCVSNKICDTDVFICLCPENIPKWDKLYKRCVECVLNQDCKSKKCINKKCEE